MVATIIAIVALVAVVSWAIWYIATKKKRGNVCIGCPVEGTCGLEALYAGSSDTLKGKKMLPLTPVGSVANAGKAARNGARTSESGCGCCC